MELTKELKDALWLYTGYLQYGLDDEVLYEAIENTNQVADINSFLKLLNTMRDTCSDYTLTDFTSLCCSGKLTDENVSDLLEIINTEDKTTFVLEHDEDIISYDGLLEIVDIDLKENGLESQYRYLINPLTRNVSENVEYVKVNVYLNDLKEIDIDEEFWNLRDDAISDYVNETFKIIEEARQKSSSTTKI
ncbi:hypothetical protein H9M94_01085 [Mycoplasma sp. Pen4]|uniref:Mbov_0392 family ICE element protein n=1 Tax=Mycoplasma sp. Pen4 TaxID=640330 RepID=UPI001653FC8B|nr:hypothetical protein [Mycoplasma sp. Pen4]QNM93757.1 hypothetical protein H9M94_00570 [Mycoplasma sp. Pen4]QNM93853.1 hypothetical protein H9M94_01085 [Mycoplasma sp. Pen4]